MTGGERGGPPESTAYEADALRRREVLRNLAMPATFIAAVYCAWFTWQRAWLLAGVLVPVIITYVGTYVTARRRGAAFAIFGMLGFFATMVGMTVTALTTGGNMSPALFWINLPPMMAYFVFGKRAGSLLFAASLALAATISLVEPSQVLSANALAVVTSLAPVLVIASTYAFTVWLERGRAQSFAMVIEANERLARARDDAQHAHRAKSELIAVVSHELRTPLNAITTSTDLLLADALSPADLKHARVARDAAGSLALLVEDLLDVSRLDAKRLELRPTAADIVAVVRGVVAAFAPAAVERRVALEARLPAEPAVLWIDAGRVRQIAANLVDNALKFTANGRIDIELAIRPAADGQVDVELVVKDTGPGIPPEEQSAVFDRFHQVDRSTTRRHGGVGLGLSIARELAQLMQGTVELVRSVPGEGTEFRARVRARPASAADTGATSDLAGLRVLLAEDNVVNQRLVSLTLEAAGATVDVASNGNDAVRLATEKKHDLVLMDCHMPELDGFQAAQTLRSRGFAGPILAVTAAGSDEDVARARSVGMDELLRKPIAIDQIRAALARCTPK